jgi:tRNA (guanine37-N1)-methyltransferase
MDFKIISIFPNILKSYLSESIIGRAIKNKIINVETRDLRDWTSDKHKTVDDTPYGGGAGMVMKIEPLYQALKELKGRKKYGKDRKVILLSAKGKTWNQGLAKEYSKLKEIIFVCGRYEGVDERLVENFIDEEVSIGDYVLTGGELGAIVIIDSLTRLLPGALGNEESAVDESHSQPGILEYPQYTKPAVFKAGKKAYTVPEALLSGNHKLIHKWREDHKSSK